MNRLIFKLLYRHISPGQMAGFLAANLLGMCIVLTGWQFYRDAMPVLTAGDSFMKPEYAVVSKRVSIVQTARRNGPPAFTPKEMQTLARQPFAKSVAPFTPARFSVYAAVGTGRGLSMGTDMFFESLPDRFVDADLREWRYREGSDSLPVILPRSYLNLYNFGYAQARGLPALTEGMVGMIGIRFTLSGTTGQERLTGRVVGFSNRLNTILVPQSFMEAANRRLAPDTSAMPSRIIVELAHGAADEQFARYLQQHGLEAEAGMADGGKAAWFMRHVAWLVMGVGLVICALAFYVLLLSIFILLQKHTERIRTLLLIGYSPRQVALPFHLLSLVFQALSVGGAVLGLMALRPLWTQTLLELYPSWEAPSTLPALGIALLLWAVAAVVNLLAVRKRIRT